MRRETETMYGIVPVFSTVPRLRSADAVEPPAVLVLPFIACPLSCLLRDLLAEQSRGAEDDDGDQHQEGNDVLVLGPEGAPGVRPEVRAGEALEHAEDDAAQQGSGEVADTAEDGCCKGLDTG